MYYWPDDSIREQKSGDHTATLHSSESNPSGLNHIIMFENAHPQFADQGIIYVKTNLEILPKKVAGASDLGPSSGVEGDGQGDGGGNMDPRPSNPIAMFVQHRLGVQAKQSRSFKFDGWYHMKEIDFFEPHSENLGRMLKRKFTRTDRYGNVSQSQRSKDKWEASIARRWAALELERDLDAEKTHNSPDIPIIEHDKSDPVHRGKTVNEMLKELRMKDDTEKGVGDHVCQ